MTNVSTISTQGFSGWQIFSESQNEPQAPAKPPATTIADQAAIVSLSQPAKDAMNATETTEPFGGLKAANTSEELAELRTQIRGQLILTHLEKTKPEGAEALREALKNGTVKTQLAADVEGVNYKTKQTKTYDANGLLTMHMSSLEYFKPSSLIQSIIDAGRGAPMYQDGVGDVWITW